MHWNHTPLLEQNAGDHNLVTDWEQSTCMAAAADQLSLAEFQLRCGHSERAYEYWRGEATPKGMPTWIHGFLQSLLCELLKAAGYKAGGDIELRIVPDSLEWLAELLAHRPENFNRTMTPARRRSCWKRCWNAVFVRVIDDAIPYANRS